MAGARIMALEAPRHRYYPVTAQLGPPPSEWTAADAPSRLAIIPGSFTLLVYER